MSPPSNANPMPPPAPVYSLPPRNAGFPLWGKILLGCGGLAVLLIVLLGVGLTRLVAGGKAALQTQFCFENLRASHRALDLYSQDYDQTLPQATAWMDAAAPYVKNGAQFFCPVAREANPAGFGYAFNSKLSGLTAAKIDAPEKTALVYDSSNLLRNASDAVTSLPPSTRHVHRATRSNPNAPKAGNLIVYADGHVQFVGLNGDSVEMSRTNIRRSLFSQPQKKTK